MSVTAPLYSDDREADLWRAYKDRGSLTAREQLFLLHMPFAKGVAFRDYRRRQLGDLELPEVQQLAYTGLLEAIDSFSLDAGVPFRGYAVRRIAGSISDGINSHSDKREQLSLRHRMRRERMRSLAGQDPLPKSADSCLAALADIAVGLAIGFMLEGTGLYRADENDTDTLPDAYRSALWRETTAQLAAELERLPPRESSILRSHYLLGVSFEQIAQGMNLSRGRVSQLHRSGLATLAKHMSRSGAVRPQP